MKSLLLDSLRGTEIYSGIRQWKKRQVRLGMEREISGEDLMSKNVLIHCVGGFEVPKAFKGWVLRWDLGRVDLSKVKVLIHANTMYAFSLQV